MTKIIFRTSRLWWLLFVSLPLVCHQPVPLSACYYYPSEGDDLRFFLFRPDLSAEPAWAPFYYTRFFEFGNNPYEWPRDATRFQPERQRDEQAVVGAWQQELSGSTVRMEDITGLLYQSRADSLLGHLDSLNHYFGENTFVTALRRPGREPLWEYLLLLKKIEKQSTLYEDWDLPKEDVFVLEQQRDSLLQAMLEQLRSGKFSPFLQTRYAFTALRLAHYTRGDQAETVKTLYEQYLQPLPDSTALRNWALLYLTEYEPDSLRRNYQYSLVFDHCDSKKQRCKNLFQSRLAEQVLPLARNAHEKATILTLRELNNAGQSLDGIRQILSFAPTDHYLQLLVSREINKVEDWIFTPEVLGIAGSRHYSVLGKEYWETDNDYYDLPLRWRATDLRYLRRLRQSLVEALPRSGTNADFFRLAIAHLYLLDRQPATAAPYVQAVRSERFMFQVQKHLLQLELVLQTRDLRSADTQGRLTEELRWLESRHDSLVAGSRSFALALSLCAGEFEKKGLSVEAKLLRNRGNLQPFFNNYTSPYYVQICRLDRTGSIAEVQQTIRLLEKPQKTAFEKLLAEPYQMVWPFYDLLGTMYMREGRVAEAWTSFSKVPDEFWKRAYDFSFYLDDDPFDRVAPLNEKPSFNAYTKTSMAAKLLELEKTAREHPDQAAECYRQLGNAWFNFSWYGHSWMMLSYSQDIVSFEIEFSPLALPDYAVPRAGFEREYIRAEKSKTYYQMAIKAAPGNPEIRAYATFMLAHLARTIWEQRNDGAFDPDAYAETYYRNYRETEFYKSHPCPTIEAYMAGRK